MKKFISILCVMALAVSLLAMAGCGSKEIPADSPYIGTWKAVRAELMGEETDVQEALEGGEWIITLKADGTVEQTSQDESSTGVWQITKKGIKVKFEDSKGSMKFNYENGQLTTKLVATFYFDKQS